MKKRKKNSNLNPELKIFLKVQILSAILYSAFIIMSSLILYTSTNIPTKYYFYIITGLITLANFISGYYTGIKIRKNGLFTALLFCLPLTAILIIISIVLNSFKADLTVLISALIMLVGAMLGGVTSVNTKIKPKR